MMSSLLSQRVGTSNAIHLPTRGDANAVNSFVIFTVPQITPSRVEAVYMDVAFPDGTGHQETWELTLRAQNGAVLGRANTAQVGTSTSYTGTRLTFARELASTPETPPVIVYFDGDTDGTALVQVGLPGLVLPAGSTVELTIYETSDGGLPAIDITGIAVTYTPNGTGASLTAIDLTPYLLPVANS